VNNSGALRSFKHRNFRVLYPASVVSNIGTWAQRVAQDWLVLELTNSAADLGIVTGLQFLPTIFLSMWGGALADRFNKRKLLMLTAFGGGITSGLLGLLVLTRTVQTWHVYALALIFGIFSAVDAPIRTSFNSELVGKADIANAVSLNSANFNLGRLVGPALSGYLILLFGTGWSFLVNSLSYVFVIIALNRIRPDELHITQKPDRGASIKDGIKYVRENLQVRLVMITVFFSATFGLNFQIFNALMAKKEFGLGPAEFGSAGSVLAIGSLTAAIIGTRLENSRVPKRIMIGAMLFGLLVASLSFAQSYVQYLVILPFAGAIALTTFIFANSYVQTTTPANLRGRVMGIYLMIFMGGTPLGSPVIGWAAGAIGIRATVLICGLITTTAAALVFMRLRESVKSQSQSHAEHNDGDEDVENSPEHRF
jgi:MFS family permease